MYLVQLMSFDWQPPDPHQHRTTNVSWQHMVSLTSGPGLPWSPRGPGGPFIAICWRRKIQSSQWLREVYTKSQHFYTLSILMWRNRLVLCVPGSAAEWPGPAPPVLTPPYPSWGLHRPGTAQIHQMVKSETLPFKSNSMPHLVAKV